MGRAIDRAGPGDQQATGAGPPPAWGPPPPAPGGPETPVSTGPAAQPGAPSAAEHHAAHLSETSASAYIYGSMGHFFRSIGPDAYKLYLLQVLKDAGDPSDPIERMLIEQICLAHHNIGRLHVKAAGAEGLDEARIYLGSAALITGEFRRTVATLKGYREPSKATPGKAEPVRAGLPADAAEALQEAPAGELAGNAEPGAAAHDATTIPFAAQPEAGAGGPAECHEAEGADARRAPKPPRRGVG